MANFNDIQTYVADEAHRSYFLQELFKLLRMPTVSTVPDSAEYFAQCSQHLAEFGRTQLNMDTKVVPTAGWPGVIMHSKHIPGAPKVLIYGHYDVQPADDTDLWNLPPFEPCVDGNIIRGRGTCDDKGQFFLWLSALKTLQDLDGCYPLNVSVVLEGEEEIGSVHFEDILTKYADELKADAIIVSDTSSVVAGVPVLHYTLRGVVPFELNMRTASMDLHSGVHGGVSASATREMSQLIAKMHDENCRVTIPGFYEGVLDIQPWEVERLAQVPFNAEEYSKSFDMELYGEEGYTTNQRRWFRPSLECTGISGGYAGVGIKAIVPATCTAKFCARIVPNQDPDKVMECIRTWAEANTPSRVKLEFVPLHGTSPYILETTGVGAKLFDAAERAIQSSFGYSPLVCRNGGAIGVVALMDRILKAPTLLLGYGGPCDFTHAPNENFCLSSFYNGIAAGAELLRLLAEGN